MEENVFATSRSGHELKDMYDPETNTLDIRSNGLYPSNVLSNLCSNSFRFDVMQCGSMEGFLQSLKQQDLDKQRQICSMKGGNARKRSVTSWQTDQIVWWKGRAINRQSPEYSSLIDEAYQAMFDQNERFRTALMQTRGMNLGHTTGENDPFKTILTPREFCSTLEMMRWEYDQQLTEDLKPVVTELETGTSTLLSTGSVEGATGRLFSISPIALADKKLIIRTDVGLWYIDDVWKYMTQCSTGLKVERVTELNDTDFEVVLIPQPLDDPNQDYILATDFSGEFFINLLTENRRGERRQIGAFDYIDK